MSVCYTILCDKHLHTHMHTVKYTVKNKSIKITLHQ